MSSSSKIPSVCVFCYKTCKNRECFGEYKNGKGRKQKDPFQRVSRFISLLDRFIISGPGGESSVSDLKWSKYFSCCRKCLTMVDEFCAAYHELEVLELQVSWKLERLVKAVELAGRVPSRWTRLRNLVEGSVPKTETEGIWNETEELDCLDNLKGFHQHLLTARPDRLPKCQPRVSLVKTPINSSIPPGSEIPDLSMFCSTQMKCEVEVTQLDKTDIKQEYKSDVNEWNLGDIQETQAYKMDGEEMANFSDASIPEMQDESEAEGEFTMEDMCVVEGIISGHENADDHDSNSKTEPGIPESSNITAAGAVKRKKRKVIPNDEKTMECPHCDKMFSSARHLTWHVKKVHVPYSHKCSECDKSFKTGFLLRRHQIMHTRQATNPFHCSNCDKKFPSQARLDRHLGRVHRIKIPVEVEDQKIATCSECGKICRGESELKRHMKDVHVEPSHQCSDCGKVFKRKYLLDRHALIHKGPEAWKFQCSVCGYMSYTKINLEMHMGTHETGSSVKCQFCSAQFSGHRLLTLHVRSEHIEKGDVGDCEIFQCSLCDTKFLQEDSLKRHMGKTHAPRDHRCSECDKAFRTKFELSQHALMHADESTFEFQCSVCEKKCRRKIDLRKHMLSHSS